MLPSATQADRASKGAEFWVSFSPSECCSPAANRTTLARNAARPVAFRAR